MYVKLGLRVELDLNILLVSLKFARSRKLARHQTSSLLLALFRILSNYCQESPTTLEGAFVSVTGSQKFPSISYVENVVN